MPGVQMPHCAPPRATSSRWTACRSGPSARPSTNFAAAARAFFIFSPAIEPDVSITIATLAGAWTLCSAFGTSTQTATKLSFGPATIASDAGAEPTHAPALDAVGRATSSSDATTVARGATWGSPRKEAVAFLATGLAGAARLAAHRAVQRIALDRSWQPKQGSMKGGLPLANNPAAAANNNYGAAADAASLNANGDLSADQVEWLDEVAARSGVAKSTLYRHFGSKEALIARAARGCITEHPTPDTGNLEDDLFFLFRAVPWQARRSAE